MAFRDDFLNTIQTLESNGVQGRTSSKGATGRMQTMKATRTDPGFGVMPARDDTLEEGDRVGRDYALALLDHYNDPAIALAAYNAGPGAVNKHGGIPPYRETQNYVRKGMGMLDDAQAPVNLTPEQEAEFEKYYAQQQEEQKPVELTPEQDAEFEKYYAEQQGGKTDQPTEGRTAGDYASDVGISLEKGIVGAGQGLVGIADIPTGGYAGKLLAENVYDLGKKQEELTKEYSPEQRSEMEKLQKAEGVAGNIQAMFEHPTATGALLMESAPSMVAGGILGKVAKVAGLTASLSTAAGIGEGVIAGGSAAENLRAQSEDKLMSGKDIGASLGTMATTFALGKFGSEATKALGGIDIDTLFAGGARKAAAKVVGEEATSPGVFKRILMSTFGEGVLEEAPQSALETMWQNYATDRPLTEGVESSAIKGGLLGSIMGATAGAISSEAPHAIVPPPLLEGGTPEQPLNEHQAKIAEEATQARKASDIEDMGITPDHKLYDELLKTDFNTPEGLAKVQTLVEDNEDLPEDFDFDTYDNLIATQQEKIKQQEEAKANAEEVQPSAEEAAQGENRYSVENEEYKGQHTAPNAESGAPLHDVTKGGEIYPDDIYSAKGLQYYGTGQDQADRESFNVIKNTKSKPDAMVTMYRAVPKDGDISTINNGDWVSLSKTYAKEHGESALNDDYKIISQKVKANELFTNGDSINEFGYWKTPAPEVTTPATTAKDELATQYPLEHKDEVIKPVKEDYLYSASPSSETTGHTAASLRRTMSPEMKTLEASGKVVLHDTQDTLPGENHPANVKGMTTAEGITHYVANKLTPSTMESVALHEVGVHAGMENMLGKELWEDVKNQALNNEGAAFDKARASVPKGTPAHLRAEETLAYLVEHSPQLSLVRRIVAAIRNFLRAKAGVNIRLSEADARQMAVASMRREASTGAKTAREETAYSKKSTEQQPKYSLSSSADEALAESEAQRTASQPPAKAPKSRMQSISDAATAFEVAALSYDAAFIKTLRARIKTLGIPFADATKLLMEASQSQTVHASSLSAQAAILGKLEKNSDTLQWEATQGDHAIVNIKPMLEAIATKHGRSYKDIGTLFGDIMVASRIKELRERPATIKEQMESATTAQKKKFYKKKYDKALALANNQHLTPAQVDKYLKVLADNPDFEKPLKEWQAVREYMVKFLVATGRYSDKQSRAYLDAISYVPFNRVMDMKDPEKAFIDMAQGHGKKLSNLSAGQREYAMKGSLTKQVDDIVTNMEKWVFASFNKGINADKGRQLVNLANNYFAQGSVTKVPAKETHADGDVAIYVGGKKQYWRFQDPLIQFAFNGVNPVAMESLKLGAKFANALRQSIVLNPLFTISQLPQDTFSAMFSSGLKNPMVLPFTTLSEFYKTMRGTSEAHAILKNIGAVGQRDPMDMYSQSIHDLAYNQHNEKRGVGASIMRGLNAIAGAGDNSLRQAVYIRTKKELGNNPRAEAIAQERAFEIINFRRRGASSAIDMVRQITPFLGAYLQAQRVALNTLTLRGIAPTERSDALKALAGTTAQVIALTVLYNALLGDDDDFKKKDAREKDTKIFLLGSKSNIALPIRPDLFSLPFVMTNHAYNYITENGVEHPVVARKAIKDALIASIVGMPMGPTVIKPALEANINHDFFTGRDIIPMRLQGREKSEQYTERTSEFAKLLGKTNLVSPMIADHVIKGMTGYSGAAILQVTDMALRAGLDLPYTQKTVLGKDIRDVPGVSTLYANEKAIPGMDRYYQLSEDVNLKFKTLSGLKTDKKREAAKEYKAEHKALLNQGVHNQLNNMREKISELTTKKRIIAETPNTKMSPDVKRAKIDAIDIKIGHIMKAVPRLENKAYK